MRQTLLGEECVKNKDHGVTSYKHIHVVPKENIKLLNRVTSPFLTGLDIHVAWSNLLKKPNLFVPVTPEDFIAPSLKCNDTLSINTYLKNRYWR